MREVPGPEDDDEMDLENIDAGIDKIRKELEKAKERAQKKSRV